METNCENHKKQEQSIEYQNRWLCNLNNIYKLYLNDEIKKNKENVEKSRNDVKKFWLDSMCMPPILECYNKPKKVSSLELYLN